MTPVRGVKPIIGLVGDIGAGKTRAASAFAARGGAAIDADALGHEALERPDVRQQLLARWSERGPMLRPDGRLDRRAIAAIVFNSPVERQALEAVVFPAITARVREELARIDRDTRTKFAILDAAVMLEAGWNGACDHLVYVEAPRSLRLARLAARSGWTEADLMARESAQMPAEQKRRHATAILSNAGSPELLQTQVDQLLRAWGLLDGAASADTGPKSPVLEQTGG